MLLNIKNEINEISRVCDEVERFCKERNISDAKYHDIILILDEVVTNIINYAYPNGGDHMFTLDIHQCDGNIFIKLSDSGIPFDPLGKDDPDVESSLERRSIGGLGIFIVKQLSEIVEYSRIDDKNQLSIIVSLCKNNNTNKSDN